MDSASFILVVRIKLKSGKILSFCGDSGYGEGNENYCRLQADADPQTLVLCGSVDELKQKLQASVHENQDLVSDIIKGRTVLT